MGTTDPSIFGKDNGNILYNGKFSIKTHFTLVGSFDAVTISWDGKGLGHNRQFTANTQEYFKFEKQSDGGFKILPNADDPKPLTPRRLVSTGTSLSINYPFGYLGMNMYGFGEGQGYYDVFYLEAA